VCGDDSWRGLACRQQERSQGPGAQIGQAGFVAASHPLPFRPQTPFPAKSRTSSARSGSCGPTRTVSPRPATLRGRRVFRRGAPVDDARGNGTHDGLEGDGGWADQPSQVQAVVAFFGRRTWLRRTFLFSAAVCCATSSAACRRRSSTCIARPRPSRTSAPATRRC